MKSKLVCSVCLLGLVAGSALAASTAMLLPGQESAVNSLIDQLKRDGQPIPADLREQSAELYGYTLGGEPVADRDGGANAASATPIVFTAGTFSDTGTTVGKVNDVNNNNLSVANGCTNQSYSSSMDAEDAFYSFTVTTEGILTADTALPGTTFDTCIAILASDGTTVKSINDDKSGDAAYRSYLECCLAPGSYYFVVDGYSSADVGNYELAMTFTENNCIPDAFACPGTAQLHVEANELGCGDYIHDLDSGETFCGTIASNADADYFWILVDAPNTTITLDVYGDDTSGKAPFGWGLDPFVTVYGDDCATVYGTDDDGGTGFDSHLLLECMTPGFYMVEITAPYTGDFGPYLLAMTAGVCCWETNSASNPAVVITESNFLSYVGEANAYTTTANLSSFCSIIAAGPGCFSNGHCIADLDGGEYWFNVYQPNSDTDCYAMYMSVSPAYTPNVCTPLVGVAQGGTLLGYFATDASAGLFPSVYNETGTHQTTFVIDAPAACDQDVTVSVWYEDLCPEVNADEQAANFELAQNFPNPFNPTTSISFTLPEAGEASLKVYDMNGREVATLVNGMTERGTHSVTFDASGLSTGVYFYTLTAGELTTTNKMVLVK